MEPKIIKTKDYIEFIGHYDDITKCAKLSALASLYAIDSKVGYAKFPIEYEKDINKALNCSNIFDYYTYYFCASNSKYNTTTITAYLYHVDCYLGYPIYKNITNSTLKINMSSNEGSSKRSVVIIDNDTGATLGTITSSSFTINAKLNNNGYFELYSFSGSSKTLSGHGTKLVKNQHYSETCSIYLQCESGSLFPYVVINLTAPPTPLTKTYNLDAFSNNSENFNQIIINGTSTDSSTFYAIDNIHYLNTSTSSNVTVFSNESWTSGYNSVLDYITTAPNVTAINSDCNSIITFTTHQVDPAGVISIGTRPLSASYVGTSEVNKIYHGTSLLYEKQAPSSDVTLTFNVNFTTLNRAGYLYFKLDTLPTQESDNDYAIVGGWAWEGIIITKKTSSTAPSIPTGDFDTNELPKTFSISIPVGTTIYVWCYLADATNQSINGVGVTQMYDNPTSYTITQDTTFNILLSGEDD